MSLLSELQRRNVFRVGAAYIVTAWLVIQVVETILPAFGFGDAAVKYVTIAFAVGFVPVLVLSWVFEWTPEGLKRETEAGLATPASLQAAKRLDRIILIVLALALGYFAFDKFVLAPEQRAREVAEAREVGRSEALVESYGDQSIAVLAFEDMSPDKDQEHLSDGIAEEVLNLLAEIPELRVISRTSAFSFKGKDLPIPEIGRQLNVAHVLEGSVRKAGDRIRITAQLIEARSDTHIWSKSYDRTVEDIFAIQDELAASVVDELQISLLGELPRARRIDPEAYVLYLEGHRLTKYVDTRKAIALLERAVELEPEFADAWADLSRAYFQMSPTSRQKDHEGDEYWAKSYEAFYRVMEIDPDHPFVIGSQAWDAVALNRDYASAARLLERGLERYPKNWELALVAIIYSSWIRRDDVALSLARAAVARDPLCTDCSYHFARTALYAGRYEEAKREIERFKALVPGPGGEITLGSALLLLGDLDGARAAFTASEEVRRGNPEQAGNREKYGDLLVRAVEGEGAGLLDEIAKFAGQAPEHMLVNVVELYAVMGEKDEAFAWLDRAMENSVNIFVARDIRSPFLKSLHDDPRWVKVQESVGVAPHQLAEFEFDPKLPNLGSE